MVYLVVVIRLIVAACQFASDDLNTVDGEDEHQQNEQNGNLIKAQL